jgi:hypothetical protein
LSSTFILRRFRARLILRRGRAKYITAYWRKIIAQNKRVRLLEFQKSTAFGFWKRPCGKG